MSQAIAQLVLSAAIVTSVSGIFNLLGTFKVSNPAFASLYRTSNANTTATSYDLLISTFSAIPFAEDTIQVVRGVGQYLDNVAGIEPVLLTTKTTWPNEVAGVPLDVFNKTVVAIPDGFILPFKTNGAIHLIDISPNSTLAVSTITHDSTGQWFYHRVLWRDMNGDGYQDAITCRAREPIIVGTKDSELLWLENPKGEVSSPWTPHVLAHGPDIFFRYVTLKTTMGSQDCIVTSQFFSKSLSVYWTTEPNNTWTDPSQVKSRVIDNSIGDVFEVVVSDVNGDGSDDLLVTNNGNNGSVFVYEIPTDFRTGKFIRHTIATGFSPVHPGQGKGAPGAPIPVIFVKDQKFPIIILSGDDNGHAYVLQKKTPDPNNWDYLTAPFLTSGGDTVGEIAVADVNGDGFTEIFVPSYSTSEMYVYTTKNATCT